MKIGKIELGFQIIESGDPKIIMIADTSKWRVIEDLPSYIDIIVPGSNSPLSLPFQKNSVQTYNSATLGMSCVQDCEIELIDLPDGIYEFCLKGGKDGDRKFHRYYLKKDKIQEMLDKAWIDSGIEYDVNKKGTLEDLLYVEGFLNMSSAHARKGDMVRAQEMYILANNRLKKHIKCLNCL